MQHSDSAVGKLVGLLSGLVGLAVGLACFVIWLWLLIHAITNKGLSSGEKIMWVLLIIFLPCLGPILYFFIGRPKKRCAAADAVET